MVALIDNNAKSAAENFRRLSTGPAFSRNSSESARLTFKQDLDSPTFAWSGGKGRTNVSRPDRRFHPRCRAGQSQCLAGAPESGSGLHDSEQACRSGCGSDGYYPEFVSRLGPAHELTMQVLATRASRKVALNAGTMRFATIWRFTTSRFQKQGQLSFFAVPHFRMRLWRNAVRAAIARRIQCAQGVWSVGESVRIARRTDGRRCGHLGRVPDRPGPIRGSNYSVATNRCASSGATHWRSRLGRWRNFGTCENRVSTS